MKELIALLICILSTLCIAQSNKTESNTKRSFESKIRLGLPIGHTESIEEINFSPDERFLVTASKDNQVIIWDIKTGKQVRVLTGHKFGVTSAKFSQNGELIISTSIDGTVKFWNTYSGIEISSFNHPGTVFSANISPNNKYLVCSYYNESKKIEGCVWDIEKRKILYNIPKAKEIMICESGKYLIAHDHYNLQMIDIESGQKLADINDGIIICAAIDSSGQNIYTAAKGGQLIKWDMTLMQKDLLFGDKTSKEYKKHIKYWGKYYTEQSFHTDDIQSILLLKNGELLTSSSDNTAKLWSTKLGVPIYTFGKYTTHFGFDNSIKTEGFHTKGIYNAQVAKCHYSLTNATYNCTDILTSGSNKVILWGIFGDKRLIWNPKTWFPKAKISPNGNFVAMQSNAGIVSVYSANDGKLIHVLKNKSNKLYTLSSSNSGHNIIVGSDNNIISELETDNWNLSRLYEGHSTMSLWSDASSLDQSGVRDIAYSHDEKNIASIGSDGKIMLWDAKKGIQIKSEYHLGNSTKLIFSLDDKHIYNYKASKDEIRIFNVEDSLSSIKITLDSTKNSGLAGTAKIFHSKTGNTLVLSSIFSRSLILDTRKNRILEDYEFTILDELEDEDTHLFIGTHYHNVLTYNKVSKIIDTIYKHSRDVTCAELSPNNRHLLTGSLDKKAIIYDLNEHKILFELQGHKNEITDCHFISDDKAITSSSDGSIILWDIITGKMILQQYIFNKNESLSILPDGYYKSTKKAEKRLHYIADSNKVLMFEQFDLKYHRPDLVLSALDNTDTSIIKAYHSAYLKRLKKMNFTEEMLKDDFHIPEIKIENFEEMPLMDEQGSIDIKLNLKDTKYYLDRINLWINDVAVYGADGISLRDKNIKNFSTTLTVNLAKGKNKVQVSVLNRAGAESYKETIEIESKYGKTQPNLYLITIGESEYKQSGYNLTYAAKDALDVAALFSNSKVYNEVKTKTFTNEQVSKENILALKAFLKDCDINDQVIIFIAGHGVLNDNLDYYFATYDMDFSNPAEKGLAYEDLENLLDGIAPLKKTLIIDACHSGEIDKDELTLALNSDKEIGDVQFRAVGNTVTAKLGSQNTMELTKTLFTDLRKGTGATVISSAGGMEFAMESEDWKNGLFTYCLLNGIKTNEADLNDDGEIWLSEIQEYVGKEVAKLSKGQQQPTSRIENQTMDFRVW